MTCVTHSLTEPLDRWWVIAPSKQQFYKSNKSVHIWSWPLTTKAKIDGNMHSPCSPSTQFNYFFCIFVISYFSIYFSSHLQSVKSLFLLIILFSYLVTISFCNLSQKNYNGFPTVRLMFMLMQCKGDSCYYWWQHLVTFASGFANFLAPVTMLTKHEYTNSSESLSPKQLKFSCSLRIDRSLYDNRERQKARSRHCLSHLKQKWRRIKHHKKQHNKTALSTC